MKATGIIRRIDDLGRIVIPMEIRKFCNINEKDLFELLVKDCDIIFRKYETSCVLCGSHEDLMEIWEKSICRKCADKIKTR